MTQPLDLFACVLPCRSCMAADDYVSASARGLPNRSQRHSRIVLDLLRVWTCCSGCARYKRIHALDRRAVVETVERLAPRRAFFTHISMTWHERAESMLAPTSAGL